MTQDATHDLLTKLWFKLEPSVREDIASIIVGLRALREAPVPSEEPVAWRGVVAGRTAFLCRTRDEIDRLASDYNATIEPLGVLASPAVAPVAVSVKGLEWQDGSLTGSQFADSAVGRYTVLQGIATKHNGVLPACWIDPKGGHHEVYTRDEAKAAAQSDFNARILSSIIPATKGGGLADNDFHIYAGAELRRLNRTIEPRQDQPIATSCEAAALDLVVAALRSSGFIISRAALAQDTDATPPSDTEEKVQ